MNEKIIRGLLVSLLQSDPQPMPETALITAAQILSRPDQPTDADVVDMMKTLASQGYIAGATDPLMRDRSWTLTTQGIHKARKLR